MAALTADRITQYSLGDLLSIPVEAGVRIFAGAIVCSVPAGFAVPAGPGKGLKMEGIATAQADNRSGKAGDLSVVVRRRGRYRLGLLGGVRQRRFGCAVYAMDDQTVAPGSGGLRPLVGVVDTIGEMDVWVSIDMAVLTPR